MNKTDDKEENNMAELTFTRGNIVQFNEKGVEKFGVNIQNQIGNVYAPTIIVAEIELIDYQSTVSPLILMEEYIEENLRMVINVDRIQTIDKTRALKVMGKLPVDRQKELDEAIAKTYCFEGDKQAQLVFVNFGKDTIGSEQGGIRPAILIKGFTSDTSNNYLVAMMTSKMSKRSIPTHVMYEEGEGGLIKPSIGLFEQLKCIKEEDILQYYTYTPEKKLPNVKQAFNISVGLNNIVKSGA